MRSELPKAVTKAKLMHKTDPLAIDAAVKANDLSGYKVGELSVCYVTMCTYICNCFFVFLFWPNCLFDHFLCQAPWDESQCSTSLAVNGLYEASGLALWMQTGAFKVPAGTAASDPLHVNVRDISWDALTHFETAFFSKAALQKSAVTRGTKKLMRERLIWPCVMVCGVQDATKLEGTHFDASLRVANGWYILWAWYLALFRALRNGVPSLHSHTHQKVN